MGLLGQSAPWASRVTAVKYPEERAHQGINHRRRDSPAQPQNWSGDGAAAQTGIAGPSSSPPMRRPSPSTGLPATTVSTWPPPSAPRLFGHHIGGCLSFHGRALQLGGQ